MPWASFLFLFLALSATLCALAEEMRLLFYCNLCLKACLARKNSVHKNSVHKNTKLITNNTQLITKKTKLITNNNKFITKNTKLIIVV